MQLFHWSCNQSKILKQLQGKKTKGRCEFNSIDNKMKKDDHSTYDPSLAYVKFGN